LPDVTCYVLNMPSTADLIRRAITIERARRGMSQRDLAAAVGRSDTWVSNRITGAVPLDIPDVDLIARGMGMTAFELVESAKREAPAEVA
jgi:transcriptional regulator with XRE-family HTH domain